jgi:dipeptidyl aminopeptidase/acylaminoacyl peptidase
VIDFAVSPEAGAAVYLADQVTDEVFELFSRSIPGAPVRLNGPLTAFGDVTSFQVSPDGTFVVYRADETSNDVFELFRAPIDGGSASVRLNSALVSGGDVVSYQVSPDGTRVVYLADQLLNGRNELFSAPSDASSSPVRLNDQLPQYGDGVLDGYLLRAGVVVFKATIPPGVIGLFAALVDGSAPATALASPAAPIGDIWSFQLTADGTRALFISGPGSWVNLHGVPTDGSSDPYRIDVGPTSGKVYALGISADGEHVAYLEAADGHDVRELVLARSDGSATPHRINRPLGRLGDVSPDFRFTADGTHLLFRAEDQDPDAFELFVRTIDGRIAGAADPDE